jgi:hypothetical protein
MAGLNNQPGHRDSELSRNRLNAPLALGMIARAGS